ncbi:c-type cytochrome [Stygiobacter electus]|uniref:Cytochrome c n=1 Tax=Stygiobacter electus TaxID=3032292 RepID=A0AAE3P106_9BACT|nr:cytochrome c [Stygiobacter electus]MDF1612404.1 cytochrome c [Stygiobacter electus]
MNTKRKLEDEINFKDVFTNPLRMFGWIFPIFIILLIALGIFYVKHLSDISFNEQPVGLIVDSTYIKKDIEMKKGGISPAVDLLLVEKPTQEFINKGKDLFKANCSSCHGENGQGDGPAGATLNPKPRNFHAVNGWTNGRTIDMMYKTLQEGIIKNGMAAYEYIPPADRFAIISYIRTFADFPPIKKEELTQLDNQYQLTKGTIIPNQIPVKTAEEKVIEENLEINKKIENAYKLLDASSENTGAYLLKNNSQNLTKVFSSFLRQKNIGSYVNDALLNPFNYGFKPSINNLKKDELNNLFTYLKTILI